MSPPKFFEVLGKKEAYKNAIWLPGFKIPTRPLKRIPANNIAIIARRYLFRMQKVQNTTFIYNYAFTCLNFAFKAMKRIPITLQNMYLECKKSTKHNLYV